MVRLWAAAGGLVIAAGAYAVTAQGPGGQEAPPLPSLRLIQERGPDAVRDGDLLASRFTVRNPAGTTVGGAYETCAKEAVGAGAVTAYCSGIIEVEGRGKIGFQASRSVAGDPRDDHAEVTGIVTGGTGAFVRADGEMVLTPPASAGGAWRAEFR
ncbi:hypothetical protein [Streptomyces sp. NPDC047123]|uniref:hypothetical protein n=1 Tax=Streptomyces sp. NPDC047123 TaxID=3155622 RepID=UPI0033D22179